MDCDLLEHLPAIASFHSLQIEAQLVWVLNPVLLISAFSSQLQPCKFSVLKKVDERSPILTKVAHETSKKMVW